MNPQTTTTARPEATGSRLARLRKWRTVSLTLPNNRPELLTAIRHLVLAHAIEYGVQTAKAEDVELCVSELLTNALRYSEGPARLELYVLTDTTVIAAVSDSSAHLPGKPGPEGSASRENGRGLQIVGKLADTVTVTPYPWGKTVIASFCV